MKKALIVIDMQNDFIDGALGNDDCKAVVPDVVNLIKNKDYSAIVIIQDTHYNNYLDTQEGKKLPVVHCIHGTDGWKLNADVQKALDLRDEVRDANIFTMEKDTFGGIELVDILSDELFNYDEIHICGVCTGICVISTVLIAKATVHEKKICIVEKACACLTPDSHKNAIEAMKICRIDII